MKLFLVLGFLASSVVMADDFGRSYQTSDICWGINYISKKKGVLSKPQADKLMKRCMDRQRTLHILSTDKISFKSECNIILTDYTCGGITYGGAVELSATIRVLDY